MYTVDEFVSDLEEARDEAETVEDLANINLDINMTYDYFHLNYIKRMRSFLTGYIFHEDFRDQRVADEIKEAEKLILDDGRVKESIEDVFHQYSPDYSQRIEEFRSNEEYGKEWLRILNSATLEIPRQYAQNKSGYVEDALEIEKRGHREMAELMRENEAEPESGRQASLFEYEDHFNYEVHEDIELLEYRGGSNIISSSSNPSSEFGISD